ncbi:VanZ family protein [Bacillus thermocopriae]|uniref:VanZ family protein n=1 Tax=Neobacillus thermocopriae TaxID=1215031 RepID=A0A6B3TU48_9BACI|nr:VanZ family protein [Neobacillus thermocopriae]MED3623494.1 VanZ family protein [Neobacillus thermocopriae]MED3715240.1 VanZ family protein [Neobacillus thermocopriae]NEX79521.1 VanZ family protein [Neobacillus thermocopriae]
MNRIIKKVINKLILLSLFVIYLYGLLRIILFKFHWMDMALLWHHFERTLGNPDRLIYQLKSGNYIPFQTIFINIHSLSVLRDFSNLFGNIALFIPFGIFLVLLSKNKGISFKSVFVLSLGLSFVLECLQVVSSLGIFDVDDLLLNTTGGLLGYFAIKLYDRIYTKLKIHQLNIDRDSAEIQEIKNKEEGAPYSK